MPVFPKIIVRILNKLSVLEKLNIVASIILNQNKFKIPIIQKMGFSNLYMSEPWMIQLLKIVLPISEGKFIDVGVNVGQTLLKLKAVSDEMEYIGFEPNPTCYYYAKQLLKTNKFKNISLVPVGISDSSNLGELHFFSNSSVDSSASMISDFRDETKVLRKEFIPLFTVDDLEKSIKMMNLAILKIDVEGGELEVIKGFYSKIKESKPIILMEILPAYSAKHAKRLNRQNELIDLLKRAEYLIYRIEIAKNAILNFKKLDGIEIHSNLNTCEYVMMPKEKESQFIDKIQHLKLSK